MKKISIEIPCFNEAENIPILADRILKVISQLEDRYIFEIVITDNHSTDGSIDILRKLAQTDTRFKVLVNSRNYGVDGRSARNSLKYLSGDVVISLACDLQDPPELIPAFIDAWESGYKIVCGQKVGSKEGKFKYTLRSVYYRIISSLSSVPQYKNISGITLLDREVIDNFLKTDYDYYLRFAIADMGYEVKLIPYIQDKRIYGKSSYNIWRSLSFSIQSLVLTSTAPLRFMTVFGVFFSSVSFVIGVIYLVLKLVYWDRFQAGYAPILIGLFFLSSILLFAIGMIGEYIGVILRKVSVIPDVVLQERINI